ncbi:MAG: hypothetical protein JSW50_13125 [Candidatus Latescibacterota bacterium]|nr:MAG: hypothetical protein JSW50_13125 [Candidatus Latescibacterota bacterium]
MRKRLRIESAGSSRLGVFVRVALFILAAGCTRPSSGWGFGAMTYQNPVDIVLGTMGSASVLITEVAGNPRRPVDWQIEATQRRLFGIDDLTTDGVAVGLRFGQWGAMVSATHLATPVGNQAGLLIEPFHVRSRVFALAGGVSFSRLTVVGTPSVHRSTVSATMAVRIIDELTVGYHIGDVRIAGETHPGADVTVYAVVRGGSLVALYGRTEVTRQGAVNVGIAAHTGFGKHIRGALGYDGATGSFTGAVACALGRVGVRAGAELHPVLGMSKSVSVVLGGGGL